MASLVPAAIARLFAANDVVTSGEVAAVAGVTRQAAHHHLRALVESGELVREGAGRGARYRRRSIRSTTYALAGLQEDRVWIEEYSALRKMDLDVFDNPKVKPILDFAVTEMVNNAIDHSEGSDVIIRWFLDAARIAFEVEDDGVGAFRQMRESRGLATDFDAIGEIAKGKQTSAPDRHSGLGIYFTSRMSSQFILSSDHLVWNVDNRRRDEGVGWLEHERRGTLVRCEVDATTSVVPLEVFRGFSDPTTFGFNRSTIRVSLFSDGTFVSRSEAKRLAAHLEVFGVVELDFTGVDQVGQGFVDELFRVWQSAHRQTRLVPVHANPAILAMIAMAAPTHSAPES
ncbi:MAG: DUF4325 domain-containing protein [Acidobacteriota bacterium]|nr:DUF4325 domain-containing protein [Acidobacteriota bacterium]